MGISAKMLIWEENWKRGRESDKATLECTDAVKAYPYGGRINEEGMGEWREDGREGNGE